MNRELIMKWLPTVIAFIGGVGVGGGAVYLKMRDNTASVAAEYEEEIQQIQYSNKQLHRELKDLANRTKTDIAKAFTEHLGYVSVDDAKLKSDEDDEDDEDYDEDEDEDESFLEEDPSDDLPDYERPPAVISKDVFNEASDYEKISLIYYVKDDTLVDDEGPIDNVEFVIGSHALTRFGGISGDPNIVYVRSYRMESDFEIVKNKHSYIEALTGFEDRDDKKRPRKMRNDSD